MSPIDIGTISSSVTLFILRSLLAVPYSNECLVSGRYTGLTDRSLYLVDFNTLILCDVHVSYFGYS